MPSVETRRSQCLRWAANGADVIFRYSLWNVNCEGRAILGLGKKAFSLCGVEGDPTCPSTGAVRGSYSSIDGIDIAGPPDIGTRSGNLALQPLCDGEYDRELAVEILVEGISLRRTRGYRWTDVIQHS